MQCIYFIFSRYYVEIKLRIKLDRVQLLFQFSLRLDLGTPILLCQYRYTDVENSLYQPLNTYSRDTGYINT